MGKTVPPKGGYSRRFRTPRVAEMERVRHDQRAAHPQAMETSDETDNQASKEIKHRNS